MRTNAIPGGKAEQLGWPPERYDQHQLALGVRVEMEHTSDPVLAQEIAMDHLAEQVLMGVPQDYYTRLEAMEEGMHPNAKWSTAYVNDLPDSAFAYIEPGGRKDKDGKTKPRSLRHLPYKNHLGKVDLPHLRNALARLSQVKDLSASKERKIREKLENVLAKHGGYEHAANVAIGGDPEHPAFQVGAEHGREDLAKGQHGDPRASYNAWLDYMGKRGKVQSWMYDPDSKLQYIYGYDSVRYKGRPMFLSNHEGSIDYEKASEMAAGLAARGLAAWPISVKLQEAGYDKALADGIAIATERRQELADLQRRQHGVRSRQGVMLEEREQMDPFWRLHAGVTPERIRRRAAPVEPEAPVPEPSLPPIELGVGPRQPVMLTEQDVRDELASQLSAGVINRQEYAAGIKRLRDEIRAGQTQFARNPHFTEEEAFAALQTRLSTPMKYAAMQVEQGVNPDQATRMASAKYGLSENDTAILHYIMDAYEMLDVPMVANKGDYVLVYDDGAGRRDYFHRYAPRRLTNITKERAAQLVASGMPLQVGDVGMDQQLELQALQQVRFDPHIPPMRAQSHHFAVNRTALDIGTHALYVPDNQVVKVIGYEAGRVVVSMPDGKPEIVSHTDLSHDAYEIQVTEAMAQLMDGTDPGRVVKNLTSEDVSEEFALTAMEDAAQRLAAERVR